MDEATEATTRLPKGPARDPAGWMSLTRAFRLFMGAAIGRHWFSIDKADVQTALMGQRSVVSGSVIEDRAGGERYRLEASSPVLAKIFTHPAGQWFSAAARSGQVRTAYAKKGGGDLTVLPVSWWRTDDPMLRFTTGCIDPGEPFSLDDDLPCWIFVNLADFERLVGTLDQWRSSLPLLRDVDLVALEVGGGIDCLVERTAVHVMADDGTLIFGAPNPPMFREGAAPASRASTVANDSHVGALAALAHGPSDEQAFDAVELVSDRSGGPGAPSSMHLVEMMLRERAAAGIMRPTLGGEARELVRLFAERDEWNKLRAPTAKTIMNVLGPVFRKLRQVVPK